jgi:hypothetical protein
MNDASNRGTVEAKWLVLDFTLLWQTLLKCVSRTMAYTVVFRPWIATQKIIVLRIATVKSLREGSQGEITVVANHVRLQSGLPRDYSIPEPTSQDAKPRVQPGFTPPFI